LGCIILGGFYYASQASKQKSIEKQQAIKLQEDRKIEVAKAEKECEELGNRMYESDNKEAMASDGYSLEPLYKFNYQINKCLYSGGIRIGNYWERYVKDALTNQTMLSAYNPDTGNKLDEQGAKAMEDYWAEHNKLFVRYNSVVYSFELCWRHNS
jgi:hypothetical protein